MTTATRVGRRAGPSTVRAGQWWNHKLPPLVAIGAIALARSTPSGTPSEAAALAGLLCSSVGVAAFGHLVNDWADIESDARAGAANRLADLAPALRTALVTIALVVGLTPWWWLPRSGWTVGLLAAEIVALVGYSLPPVRLKERGIAGVIADSAYAFVLPWELTLAVFAARPGAPTMAWWVPTGVGAWGLCTGLRGILWHQIDDLETDRTAGVRTLATHLGTEPAERLTARVTAVELVVAVVVLAALTGPGHVRWLGPFAVAYALWRWFQVTQLWNQPWEAPTEAERTALVRLGGFVLVNEFLEKWLPLAAVIALTRRDPWWWLGVLAVMVLFRTALVEVVTHDLRAVPDGATRLAFEARARSWIRRAAEARAVHLVHERQQPRALGSSRPIDTDRPGPRWVFVVCGPAEHLLTLATGVAHLAPLTDLEIWVLTDPARNEFAIDVPGVRRVVEVSTPGHLDDHQASIWLKTSVHRHIPAGTWCYLDTDVIAVAPGVDEIFDEPRGVVAFASDLTIAANNVDRFSPWAMNCGCSGMDHEHSCDHLRAQLHERLGLDVPGDWVHYNGGVFVFDERSTRFLDTWHHLAVSSFDWPEWKTRDQGALIATVWSTEVVTQPRLSSRFNFIADLGNSDLCLDPDLGWALHPSGPWVHARFLHLYTSRLDDPAWDLNRDVEAPVIRRTLVRTWRWRRAQHLGRWGALLRGNLARRTLRRWRPRRIAAAVRRRISARRTPR